jgi:hypothetical protein
VSRDEDASSQSRLERFTRQFVTVTVQPFGRSHVFSANELVEMAMNVKHLALEWLLANQSLIVPKHISLGLICRERTPWMVAVIHDPIVVTANTWSHGRTNVLAFACSLKNKLNGNATEELSPIIIGSVTVTLLNPGHSSPLSSRRTLNDSRA